MKITVSVKNVYGNQLIYPVCDASRAFAKIAKTKTLSKSDIEVIKSIGYSVEVQPVEL